MSVRIVLIRRVDELRPGDVVVAPSSAEEREAASRMLAAYVRRETPAPNLGLATTRQLLDEIAARIEVDYVSGRPGGLDYSTLGSSPAEQGQQRVAADVLRQVGEVYVGGGAAVRADLRAGIALIAHRYGIEVPS